MNNNFIPYRETHVLPLNVYLIFYVYVFAVLMIANILPVSEVTYFLFLFLGITGISIFVIKFTYSVSIKENTIDLSIKIPIRVTLFKLKIEDIEGIEETKTDSFAHAGSLKKGDTVYFFKKKDGIKLTMLNGKIFIITGINADRIISRIKSYKSEIRG